MKRLIPMLISLFAMCLLTAQTPFTTAPIYTVGYAYLDRPYFRDVADIDNDGDMDVIGYVGFDDDSSRIAWLENTGAPSFEMHEIAKSGYKHYARAVDFDMDGDLDVLASKYANGSPLFFFENHLLGDFVEHQLLNLGGYYSYFDVTDVDGDLDPDVLRIAPSIGGVMFDVTWLENDGDGNITEHVFDNINTPEVIKGSDLDEDGDMDIIVATSIRIFWYEQDGGVFTRHLLSNFGDLFFNEIYVDDMDADGDKDIITVADYVIKQYENNGSETFTTSFTYDPPSSRIYSGIGNINADAYPDLFINWTLAGVHHNQCMYGSSDFTFTLTDTITDCGSEGLTYGDMDRDGDVDFVVSENCPLGFPKDVEQWSLNGSSPVPCAAVENVHVYTDSLGALVFWDDAYADSYKVFAKCVDCPGPSPTLVNTVYVPNAYVDDMLACHTYKIKVRAFCGGSTYGSPVLTVMTDGAACRQEVVKIDNEISVFPNPASSKLIVSGYEWHSGLQIAAVDIQGKIVSLDNTTNEIDISSLPSGYYFLIITDNGFIQRAPFIKQ